MISSPIDAFRKQLTVRRTAEQAAALYDKHNARCYALGLNRATEEQCANQGCQYVGGFPAVLPDAIQDKVFELLGAL